MFSSLEIGYINIIISKDNFIEACRQHYIFELLNHVSTTKKINLSSNKIKERIQRRVDLEVSDHDRNYGYAFHHSTSIFYLNLKLLNNDFPNTFEQRVCVTISHEMNHLIIHHLEGIDASAKYDNIYRRLRDDGFNWC